MRRRYTGIGFYGFITFFVTADDVAIAARARGEVIAFQNILLPSAQKVDAESVSLSDESASVRIGESKQLTATVKPDNTTIKTLTWTSSDEIGRYRRRKRTCDREKERQYRRHRDDGERLESLLQHSRSRRGGNGDARQDERGDRRRRAVATERDRFPREYDR